FVNVATYTIRLIALENPDPSSRAQHTMNLLQPRSIVAQIAKSEGRGHQVQRVVREGKRHRVTLDPPRVRARILAFCKTKHLMGEIKTCDRLRVRRTLRQQRACQV